MEIPWERLGIPKQHRQVLDTNAPVKARMAAARGLLPVAPSVQLAMFYVLLGDSDARVVEAAKQSFKDMPAQTVSESLTQRSHPKILEYLAELRVQDQGLMERVLEIRICNDRTVLRIAEHAEAPLCETMSRNQERLLLTPEAFLVLSDNPSCAAAWVEKMEGFLRMQGALPKPRAVAPPPSPEPVVVPEPQAAPTDAASAAMAEVEAALAGLVSPSTYTDSRVAEELDLFDLDFLDDAGPDDVDPMLAGFQLDYQDEAQDFSWDLVQDQEGAGKNDDEEERKSLEKVIRDLPVGKQIKLAYLGNSQARRVLIRSRNKMVAGAVVKSCRMNEREVENAAGNRNLDSEVIRELTRNRDYMRKYKVKKALLNNPKTPVSVATGLIKFMHDKDIKELSKNKNISSIIQTACKRLVAQKQKR